MKVPLKLSAIEQEHLQELYTAAGVARDELPYTPQFAQLVEDFHNRTFKNADAEQVFGALLKYTRTGGNTSTEQPLADLNEDQLKQVKTIVSRHTVGGKILPYSDEFNAARTEFQKAAKVEIAELDFWRAVQRAQGAKRRPPPPRKKAVAAAREEEDDGE